ncbi:hypothetical protein AN641_09100, partial [Candidatus Epulonipiscioides gigas]
MYYISERQSKILQYLKIEKQFVTGNTLAKKFKISDRTIRSEIQAIKKICGEEIIVAVKHKGYRYNINYSSNGIYCALDIVSPKDRLLYIIKSLLLNVEGIDIFELADELFVSEKSIETDIVRIKKILQDIDLINITLTRTDNTIKLNGTENIIDNVLYEICKYQEIEVNYEEFQKIFNDINIGYINFLVVNVLNKYNYSSRYLSITRFTLDIALMIESIYNHYYHRGSFYRALIEKANVEVPDYYNKISTELQNIIKDKLNIKLNEEDNTYIQYVLYITHKIYLLEIEISQSFTNKDDFYLFCIKVFDKLKNNQGIYFVEDDELISSFILHLRLALERSRLGFKLYNPLGETLANQYIYLIEIAIMIAEEIEQEYHTKFNFNEITYIGIHLTTILFPSLENNINKLKILLYIPEGNGNLTLIRHKLSSLVNMSDIIINGVTDLFDAQNLKQRLLNYNLIITSSKRFDFEITNIYTISKLFDKSCQYKIQKIINEKITHIKEQTTRKIILNITNEQLFIPNLKLQSKEEIISYLSNVLIKENFVDTKFEHYVLQREKIADTDLESGAAFPHSLKNIANRPAVLIAILTEPII